MARKILSRNVLCKFWGIDEVPEVTLCGPSNKSSTEFANENVLRVEHGDLVVEIPVMFDGQTYEDWKAGVLLS